MDKAILEKCKANTQLALRLWAATPPDKVTHGLETWKCGTAACFGGHLVLWPEFIALGVESNFDAPTMIVRRPRRYGIGTTPTGIGAADVAHELFFNSDLFNCREPDEKGTDHEVVTHRLTANLATLEDMLEAYK